MAISRRKFLKLSLAVGMVSLLPAPFYKRASAALPIPNLSHTGVPDSYWRADPNRHYAQDVGCGGTRGYAGTDPSMIYWDIHSQLSWPNRDHRLAIGGTWPNARGARIIELHGWLEKEIGSSPGCHEDPPDATFGFEIDPRFTDAKGIDLGGLMRVGSIVQHNTSGNDYVAVSPPLIHVEIKSWRPGQRCGKCEDNRAIPEDAGWTAHPPELSGCADGRNFVWPWDPRYASNDPSRRLQGGDYLCVIGALVTDDPHWADGSALQAWGDRILKWGTNPKEHPYNPARWTEIHPPDHVHALPPKAREETVRCVAMVAKAGPTTAQERILNLDIHPPSSRPDPLATLECVEAVGGETTTDLIVDGNSARNGARITKHQDHVNVYVFIRGERGIFVRKDADFKAIYRVFWRLGPPQLRLSLNVQRIPVGEPVSFIVSAHDWHSGNAIRGQVKVDGQVIGETNTAITYSFHEGNKVTVVASSYNDTAIGMPIILRKLRVSTNPSNIEGSGQVTVYAEDAGTGTSVPSAKVYIRPPRGNFREVAPVGVPFSFTASCRFVITRRCPPPCRRPCSDPPRPGCCEPDIEPCEPEGYWACSSIQVKAPDYEEVIVYQGREEPL